MITEQKTYGNCLEGIGIPDKGIAVIDTELNPEVFDVVWCDGALAGAIGGFLKQIIKTGKHAVVHTCYKDGTKDYAFHPAQIYGVVLRVMDEERNTVWMRHPAADVVETVKCKECRFCFSYENSDYCDRLHNEDNKCLAVYPEGYCFLGERRP